MVALNVIIVLSAAAVGVASAETDNYLTLTADCSRTDAITVHLRTSEPFEGLLYSRNHASSCGVAGVGGPLTTLVMHGEGCGVEHAARDAGNIREVDLYVQHDSFVQQVIDEQFLVQCWPGDPEGRVSYLQNKRGAYKQAEIVRKGASCMHAKAIYI